MRYLLKVLKALADPNRVRILKMLEIRPLCVCEITDVLHLATSTVSKHLAILRDAGLIVDSKDGKWVDYALNDSLQQPYVNELLPLLYTWLPEDTQIHSDAEKVQSVDRNAICRSRGFG
ncbi:MAG: ArsR/SmtB family transcription factor [bacterium]